MSQPPKYGDIEKQPLTQQVVHRHIHCCPDCSACTCIARETFLYLLWGVITIVMFGAGIFFASESQKSESHIDNSLAIALATTLIFISAVSILFGFFLAVSLCDNK